MKLVRPMSTESRQCVHRSSDREYRKAVHWLETLRLRRVKILESGYKVCGFTSMSNIRVAHRLLP